MSNNLPLIDPKYCNNYSKLNLSVEDQLDLIRHTLSSINISIASINGAIEMIALRLNNLEIKK